MPIKFGPGEKVKSNLDTYVVETVLSQGAFAHAAKAQSTARGGSPVFLKRYFSPTTALPWYDGFVAHQQELKRRITANDGLRQYCYGFIDFFQGTEGRSNKTFHQVFEFVENGKPLTTFLNELAAEGPTSHWEQRVTFARVMMMGIAALHDQRIVHTDLKPDNLLLIPNTSRAGAYHLKLIDMDWAIFSDRKAPWDGQGVGYVGTPGYMSPEHIEQKVPAECSDVYTCAIMLAELLAGEHPFVGKRGDDANLARAVKAGDFRPFKLAKPVDKVENSAFLEALVNFALHPSASQRPTAAELKDALFGRGEAGKTPERPRPTPAPAPPPAPAAPRPSPVPVSPVPATKPAGAQLVELMHDGKVGLRIGIDTVVGKPMLEPLSADAQFFDAKQFRIYRAGTGEWMVEPLPGTPNETMLDGHKLLTMTALRNGMRLAVGNSAKGIEKLPLTVRLT
jgi:serine/threonine protein kinase